MNTTRRAPWVPAPEPASPKPATVYAVLPWRGDNMYRIEQAIRVFKREHAAARFARTDTTGSWVVRTFELDGRSVL